METVGVTTILIVLQILKSMLFAIPAGFGLAAGFYTFKRVKSWHYRKKQEKATMLEAKLSEA